ncbi:basic salivary proline-rich protein 1-like [Mustela nigripes]|uniref:basic salivary proline-rich protein 1-like n=1 Tax=Mustela nigripes TaxID=77151 RepID=UPI0028160054|nr:basic salivary proline-rich protein 1-like [Mustela nigripes]
MAGAPTPAPPRKPAAPPQATGGERWVDRTETRFSRSHSGTREGESGNNDTSQACPCAAWLPRHPAPGAAGPAGSRLRPRSASEGPEEIRNSGAGAGAGAPPGSGDVPQAQGRLRGSPVQPPLHSTSSGRPGRSTDNCEPTTATTRPRAAAPREKEGPPGALTKGPASERGRRAPRGGGRLSPLRAASGAPGADRRLPPARNQRTPALQTPGHMGGLGQRPPPPPRRPRTGPGPGPRRPAAGWGGRRPPRRLHGQRPEQSRPYLRRGPGRARSRSSPRSPLGLQPHGPPPSGCPSPAPATLPNRGPGSGAAQ